MTVQSDEVNMVVNRKSVWVIALSYLFIFMFVFSVRGYGEDMDKYQNDKSILATTDLSTPQAAFTHIAKAHNSGDWNKFVKLHSSNTKGYFIFRALVLNGLAKSKEQSEFDNAMQKWLPGLEKHLVELKPIEQSLKPFFDFISTWEDRDSFLAGIYKYNARTPRPYYSPKIKNVVIDGNRAYGTASYYTDHGVLGAFESTDPQKVDDVGEFVVYFIKSGNSWLLSYHDQWRSVK